MGIPWGFGIWGSLGSMDLPWKKTASTALPAIYV